MFPYRFVLSLFDPVPLLLVAILHLIHLLLLMSNHEIHESRECTTAYNRHPHTAPSCIVNFYLFQ